MILYCTCEWRNDFRPKKSKSIYLIKNKVLNLGIPIIGAKGKYKLEIKNPQYRLKYYTIRISGMPLTFITL